jgi:hypothetical protein
MGCGDSKNVNVGRGNDSAAPVAGVVSRSPEEGCEAKPTHTMRQFTVVLEKRNESDSLGMNIGVLFSSRCLVVKELNNEGLVSEWNENNVNTPDRIVRAGDLIFAVNGTTGRVDTMMNRLKEQTLMLTVGRQEILAKVPPKETSTMTQDLPPATTAPQELAAANVTPKETTIAPQEQAATNATPSETTTTQEPTPDPNVERSTFLATDQEAEDAEDQEGEDVFVQMELEEPRQPRQLQILEPWQVADPNLPAFKEITREVTGMSERANCCNRLSCSPFL